MAGLIGDIDFLQDRVFTRESLVDTTWQERLQLGLGLLTPYLISDHILGTRMVHEVFGVNDSYYSVLLTLWVFKPSAALTQVAAIDVLHGYEMEAVTDASGDYGPGSYVRNPPGTSHAPWSENGCTIFVKLRQFQEGDLEQKVFNIHDGPYVDGRIPGADRMYLHEYGEEMVWISKIEPNTYFPEHVHPGGEEFVVIEGEICDENHVWPQGSWVRFPDGSRHSPFTKTGCLLWVKTGHLSNNM